MRILTVAVVLMAVLSVVGCSQRERKEINAVKSEAKSVVSQVKAKARGDNKEYIYSVIKALQTKDKEKITDAILGSKENENILVDASLYCKDKPEFEKSKCAEDRRLELRKSVDRYDAFTKYSSYFPVDSKIEILEVKDGIAYIRVTDKNNKSTIIETVPMSQELGILSFDYAENLFKIRE
jgi:hypothetical protein